MEKEKIIYTEVYTILSKLPNKYIEKIPKNILKDIFDKADTKYAYKIKEMLPESKAMLAEIIKNYFGEEQISKKLEEYIQYARMKYAENKKNN